MTIVRQLSFFSRTEILRVLLLLLIEPTSQNISPTLTTVLEKYAWESEDNPAAQDTVKYLSEEIFLLLQSVVMAVQIRDYAVLLELEDQLGPLMTALPRKLLRRLVNNMKEKGSGTS